MIINEALHASRISFKLSRRGKMLHVSCYVHLVTPWTFVYKPTRFSRRTKYT